MGLVRLYLPQVEAVQADYNHPEFMDYIEGFFSKEVKTGDLNRTEQYRQQMEREKLKARFYTLDEYNTYLQTEVDCRLAAPEDCTRLSELSMRTNQFNLAESRYTADELRSMLEEPEVRIVCLSARDRFGDMGVAAMAVLRDRENHVLIEGMMVSCRIFGRGFEQRLLEKVKMIAGTKPLSGRYVKNAKNTRFESFYSDHGVETV